jgi:N-carbamoyl-L-amino-acid hydrolase
MARGLNPDLRINSDRLWASLEDLAKVGAYFDVTAGLEGVRRLALSDSDADARRLVVSWFKDADLEVRVDRIGNTFARRRGTDNHLSAVVIGSHVDTVASGGAFDGSLGVLGGLEVVRTLNDAGVSTTRPIEIAFFTNEEGARFATGMLGSSVAAGRIPLEDALLLRDRDGTMVKEELQRYQLAGQEDVPIQPPFAYLECHIEQGPILKQSDVHIGIPYGVQGISWLEITVTGRAAHAGTTPIDLRRDAGLAASYVNVRLQEMMGGGQYGELRATMGRLDLDPNVTNVVPASAVFTIDLRNPSDEALGRAERDLLSFLDELKERLRIEYSVQNTARTTFVGFSSEIQEVFQREAETLGLTHMSLVSGAGHDAQEMAAICPTGMIFVPGEFDGISHNPREYSEPTSCSNGVNVLLHSAIALSELFEI